MIAALHLAEERIGEISGACKVRTATQRGRVIAREGFQKQVEARLGRRLVGETRGRRKKKHPGPRKNVL